jgi:DNA-binding CsgD family transcriptional regulator
MLASRFREADMLYQLGAITPASERLLPLASTALPESIRLAAFSRLTEIACDAGELTAARNYLAEMRNCADVPDRDITVAGRAELNYAMARYAFSRLDGTELQRRAARAIACAKQAPGDDRVASLATRINCYLAVDRYHRRDLAGASHAAALAAATLRGARNAPAYVKTHAYTTRAVIDLHDPARAHLATAENIQALEIALENGMVSTAHDALFNIVNFWLYCDDSGSSRYETRVVRESLADAFAAPSSNEDPVLAALSLSMSGRYAEAVDVLDGSRPQSREKASDWQPLFWEPVTATKRARILFKAGKFAEAARAAADALDAWERSQLGGHGTALRVRAEALEALGDVHGATAAIEDAIEALESIRPLHHMLGAYQCGHRLTKKRAYRDGAHDLLRALKKQSPRRGARLTPREREIAQLVARGYSNKAVAEQLKLSTRTVENHVASIFSQLSIRARWQLTPAHIEKAPPS